MGSIVEFRCSACTFSTGELQIGWGKAGRAVFWGGLARCEPCGELGVADITARRRSGEDPRCPTCKAMLTMIEGTSVTVSCPRCHSPLRHATLGSWN